MSIITFKPTPNPKCPYVKCDFSNLRPGVFLSMDSQSIQLFNDCGLMVSAIKNGIMQDVNVFNSSEIRGITLKDDPDLGSPNEFCPGGGPGKGIGGVPTSQFANCDPQGNLLIIQETGVPENTPNDNRQGGCMTFKFAQTIELVNMGLLDMDGFTNVTLLDDSNVVVEIFENPVAIEDNGFWSVNKTNPEIIGANLATIIVCMQDSGAISSLEYYACIEPSVPTPSVPTPSFPTPSAPTPTQPSAPTPTAPTPSTPSAPTPSQPSVPTPSAPTPSQPSVPTPTAPTPTTPSAPTLSQPSFPTPSAPTPSQPSAPTPTAPSPSSPTAFITESPTTNQVTWHPTVPTDHPTTSGATWNPTFATNTCGQDGETYVNCDFSTLTAGAFDLEVLIETCGFAVTAFERTGPSVTVPRMVNVFDTSKIYGRGPNYDPDLGSPNEACGGPGKGAGGAPTSPFANCEAQGNALIIQDPRFTTRPNDNISGGCFVFYFFRQVELVNLKMLDVNEPNVIITAFNQLGETVGTFTNPDNVGENGLWSVNSTQPIFTGTSEVFMMEVCLAGSAAITSLEFIDCLATLGPSTWPASVPTMGPSTGPTMLTQPPTAGPTGLEGPTAGPTAGPTTGFMEGPTQTCNIIQCNFSTLAVGVPLTYFSQAAALERDCLMSVWVTDTTANNVGNIFDSTDMNRSGNPREDPDLGSPNVNCPGGGPGRGIGGLPGATYPNCEPLGNLLIIQNESMDPSIPNDSAYGGCFTFYFVQPVTLLDFGIMDVDENWSATISITSSTGSVSSFDSPSNIGDNGHWKAATTKDLSDFVNVVTMKICLPGSGAISFINVDPCIN